MNVQTREEFLAWTSSENWPRERGRVQADGAGLYFGDRAEAAHIRFEHLPATRLVHLARTISDLRAEDRLWDGGVVWLTGWEIWGEQVLGYRIVENLRQRFGVRESFGESTVYTFREDEPFDCAGLLLQAMTFGWDTWYLPRYKAGPDEHFLYLSHDGYADLVAPSGVLLDGLEAALKASEFEYSRIVSDRYTRL